MIRISWSRAIPVLVLLTAALFAADVPSRLDHSKVGVYGTCFDFCDYSVFKIRVKDDAYYRKMAERIDKVHAQGKLNLIGLHCFDRLKHTKPIQEYIRNADRMLGAIDLRKVHAVYLNEENVTWNKGLDILNALYDHIKANYDIPVYQWYSNPMVAHPRQRADGWIIDPYGMGGDKFRKYVMKYVVLGKPVIDCVFASPEGKHAGRSAERLAATADQIVTCKEFNVPMFFYCVDPKRGSPSIWLKSDDPEIVKVREWTLGEIKKIHATDASTLPLPSADRSAGQPVPVAGNRDNVYEYGERFDGLRECFVDDAWIDGFRLLRWDGQKETLCVRRAMPGCQVAELTYRFVCEFDMSNMKATLDGKLVGDGSRVDLELSMDGKQFIRKAPAEKGGDFSLAVATADDENLKGRAFYVRVRANPGGPVDEPAVLDCFRVSCTVAPPPRREVALAPDANGRVSYTDGFQTQKHLHLSEIDNADHLDWQRGWVGTHGLGTRDKVVALRQKFVSERPLSRLRVRMDSRAHRAHAAINVLGLSLDGRQVLLQESTEGKENEKGAYRGTLEIDATQDPRFEKITEFWVHLIMSNGSTVGPGSTPNKITEYAIAAEVAK